MLLLGAGLMPAWPAWAHSTQAGRKEADPRPTALSGVLDLGLDSQIVEDSPVLRRWLQSPPNLLEEIRNTPVLPTRLQAGFESASEWRISLQDLRLGDRLTLSGDYRQSSENPEIRQYGSEVRYFLAPMGSRLNLAPPTGLSSLGRKKPPPQRGELWGLCCFGPGSRSRRLDWQLHLGGPAGAGRRTGHPSGDHRRLRH